MMIISIHLRSNAIDCDNDHNDNVQTSQIKYVNAEQKLMVTVVRCEGLQKEKGIFGGYHNDDNYDNDDDENDNDDGDYDDDLEVVFIMTIMMRTRK